MAAASQTITPPARIELFSGIPRGSNNIYPRARVIFEDNTAIALKAALDTNVVIYVINLPANYAYRMDTFSISFGLATSTEVSQFENLGHALIEFEGLDAKVIMLPLSQGLMNNTNVAGGQKVWNLFDPFTEVFDQGNTNNAPQLTVRIFDNDAVNETVAQASSTWISFLQYDILQVTDVAVNAPQPVSVV